WDLEFERLKFVDTAAAPGAAAPGAEGPGPENHPSVVAQRPALDPREMPALRFHAAELAWGDRQFGEVRATVVKLEDGVSLKELTATNTSFGANATGEW